MTSQEVHFSIPSVIDDRTRLPQYKGFHKQKFVLDMRDLKLMNSVGIRTWVQWLETFRANNQVVLVNCPVIFMNIAAIVVDVLPNEARVESVILRYVHDESGEVLRCLSTRPGSGTWKIPQILKVTEPGTTAKDYEFDGILSKSFARMRTEIEFLEELASGQFSAYGLQILTKE